MQGSYELPERMLSGHVVSDRSALTAGERGGYVLRPALYGGEIPDSPIIRDVGMVWNLENFSNERSPVIIASPSDIREFAKPASLQVTDLPIKFPHSSDYLVPVELQQFLGTIQAAIDFEHRVNPYIDEYFAYLTIDQKFLMPGQSQRGDAPHTDGIQGSNVPEKTRPVRTYLRVSTADTTLCYRQPFDMRGVNVDTHFLPAIFAAQARHENIVRPKRGEIALLDAWLVHASPPVTYMGPRTLLRLTFGMQVFNRLGNTHNEMIDYQWEMVPKPVSKDLIGLPRLENA